MNRKKKTLLIILLIILAGLVVTMIIFKDPLIIIALVIIGISSILLFISFILEKFFPKNKISKTLENTADWIVENIRV